MMKKIDFLAIGDIVIDAFIKLEDAHVHCNLDKVGCELCLRFGDKIPYESVTIIPAVGNSGNAAVSASRLGLNTLLLTNVGDDRYGQDCLDKIKAEKIGTEFVKINKDKRTNYHYVLWYDVDRTILVKHQAYEREWPKEIEKEENIPAWIYLTSLGENSLPFHDEVVGYLDKHKEVKLAFQPGTFQMKFGAKKLKDIYTRAEIFFSNVEEAERILGKESDGENKNILELCKGIHLLGPKMVALSDGERGAYLYVSEELWHHTIYPNASAPLEITGAGDAFSSTFTVALALGLSPLESFAWSLVNPMSVIQYIGAQAGLLTREKLEAYLKDAPKSYKLTQIEP